LSAVYIIINTCTHARTHSLWRPASWFYVPVFLHQCRAPT